MRAAPHSIIDADVTVGENATVGNPNAVKNEIVVIAKATAVPKNTVINN